MKRPCTEEVRMRGGMLATDSPGVHAIADAGSAMLVEDEAHASHVRVQKEPVVVGAQQSPHTTRPDSPVDSLGSLFPTVAQSRFATVAVHGASCSHDTTCTQERDAERRQSAKSRLASSAAPRWQARMHVCMRLCASVWLHFRRWQTAAGLLRLSGQARISAKSDRGTERMTHMVLQAPLHNRCPGNDCPCLLCAFEELENSAPNHTDLN